MSGTPPAQPSSPTPPSTWVTGVGTLIAGSSVATFALDIGLSERASAALTALGLVLVGFGAWLHQIGH